MQIIELHKAPLRVEGWCATLIETLRLRSSQQSSNLGSCLAKARGVPSLVLTGLHDPVVPPAKADELAERLSMMSRVSGWCRSIFRGVGAVVDGVCDVCAICSWRKLIMQSELGVQVLDELGAQVIAEMNPFQVHLSQA